MSAKKISIIGLIVCFLAILFATNPEESKHREEAKKVLHEAMQAEVESQDDRLSSIIDGLSGSDSDDDEQTTSSTKKKGGLFSTIFNSFLGDAVVDNIVDEIVYVDSYGLFSLTTIRFNEEKTTVGVGILGKVFISDKFGETVKAYLQSGEIED